MEALMPNRIERRVIAFFNKRIEGQKYGGVFVNETGYLFMVDFRLVAEVNLGSWDGKWFEFDLNIGRRGLPLKEMFFYETDILTIEVVR
jgi:hypothetical protein